MEIPVKLNEEKKLAKVVYATNANFAFLDKWRADLGDSQNPRRRDSVDFAELASYRYKAHCKNQPYATSTEEVRDYITDDPNREVAGLVFLKCDWFPDCDVIALSHFRRTWSNRIVLDYLCAHPFVAKADEDYAHKVRGAGLGLLYFIAQVAKAYDCDLIWGEATQNSCDFYKKNFRLDSVRDLIYVPREKYEAYCDTFTAKWADGKPAAELEEMLQIEDENPPFVGNKATVYTPVQILIQHFLELPLHHKMEVAAAVGYALPNPLPANDLTLFKDIFENARTSKKLFALWRAVESRNPMGTPDVNPYPEFD